MIRVGIYLVLGLLLSACAATPDRLADDYQLAEMQYLQQQKNWSFEGRLALVDDRESISVSILWRHADEQDDIELIGPLAQGRVKISVTAAQVVVDDGETRNVFYGEPEQVVAEQLGVDMPVNALKFWVLGVNDPAQSFVEQLGGFYQGGWLVRYREMQRVKANLLPKKMTAEKDKARIKLIVDQWDLS